MDTHATSLTAVNDTYSPSLHELFWGLILMLVTIGVHAHTTLFTIMVYRREQGEIAAHPSRAAALFGLLLFGSMVGIVHLIDVLIWASFFSISGCFKTFGTSFYVALADYTTVGSDIALPKKWHLLGPMSAVAGMLMFGWSAAILVMIAQKFREAGKPLL